ncbi:nucleolar protein 8 isoform X1 [Oryzias melastigma]|uniref:nucleolar protein 8 isoform X1 n=1 Tax=Oryzias melastigma TaxID=30732 RepID=UPI000CF824D7|nr:nucleolar protein 8 isoform X1 [Oryzias melastigma]XP_024125704.1 nucleolar protein 8 isoform X1 [Oryzias melastigma]XP_024125705.1 nucleolar protein 8 isoform X1 [Oryzias melastigma]
MRRLYVGGLSHAVTQKELKDRFGKFGDVVDVELRTRRDEEGVPYKTFGYINISISDADLKRCLTVLNKSKWKGGTLQIETAKESFLHRLAQERQAAADPDLQQTAADDGKQNLLDSLSKAGINNFTMKAAVPGTEVPGHKDWVVSKFGRVLPVLQLRCQKGNKARMLKYDPSKYSHNIRKLDRDDADRSTPVSQLTWQVEGGDDDISRKRRGEFPSYEPRRPKKSRPLGADTCKAPDRKRSEQKNSSDLIQSKRFSIGPTRTDAQGDLDSDEEICRLMAAQDSSHHALQQEAEESPLEVVGLEYSVKSGRKGDEDEYDSADTDELIASRRNLSPLSNERSKGRSQPGEEKVKAVLPLQTLSFKEDSGLEKKRTKTRVLPVLQHGDEEEEEEEESAGSSSDSEYEAMFSNVTRLELSLADLQRLAEEDSQAAGILGSEGDPALAAGPSEQPAPKKGTSPEEILAAILEDSDDDRPRKRKKRKGVTLPPLPAFQGTRSLQETDDLLRREEEEGGGDQMDSRTTETEGQEGEKNGALSQSPVASESSSSSEEDEEERTTETPAAEALLPSQIFSDEGSGEAAPPTLRRKLNAEEEEELQRKANLRRLSALQQRQKKVEEQKKLIQGALANLDAPPPKAGKRIVFDSDDEEENPSQTASSIIQSVEEAAGTRAVANQRAAKDKFSAPQLFDSSEDEDGAEEEENRFDLRPQFEGQAGQKLMALQYRFGTDERFRMDERFLEEEEPDGEAESGLAVEDEALEEEKKKNLSILQNLLGSSKQPSSRTPSKAAKFRDVSTLHYDPSREEHTAFETKTIQTTESKAARRKKREEAQKLPEVSSDIFYEVSGDLKAVFGQTKEELSEAEEENNWDQEEEEEDGGEEEELQTSLLPDDPITTKEESSGFKFSFFGVDGETSSRETTEYKVENIQAPKVSWQQDPRFHDSSSDEEPESQSREAKAEEPPSTMDLFFFYPGDSRLKDGPTLFCRSGQLEEQREDWEERRTMLRRVSSLYLSHVSPHDRVLSGHCY